MPFSTVPSRDPDSNHLGTQFRRSAARFSHVKPGFSLQTRVRFALWRFRRPAVLLVVVIVIATGGATGQSAGGVGGLDTVLVTTTKISPGRVIGADDVAAVPATWEVRLDQPDSAAESGRPTGFSPGSWLAREPADAVGLIALVDLEEGSPLPVSAMTEGVGEGLVPTGKVLTSVKISNPEILAFVRRGSLLNLLSPAASSGAESSKPVAERAYVVLPHGTDKGEIVDQSQWTQPSAAEKNGDGSSTVLIAVSPLEAQKLARARDWDGTFMAAIVH